MGFTLRSAQGIRENHLVNPLVLANTLRRAKRYPNGHGLFSAEFNVKTAWILPSQPSPQDIGRINFMAAVSEARATFMSHSNWLRALTAEAGLSFMGSSASSMSSLATRIAALPSMRDPPTKAVDLNALRRSLSNAWGTEILLSLSGLYATDEEIIRLANNWAVVQTYYIIYHGTQAMAAARGFPRPDSHPKTQNLFTSFWIRRPLNLSPWTVGIDASGVLNLPPGAIVDLSLHPWKTTSARTQLSHTVNAYRSTREDHLHDALASQRERKRSDERKKWNADEAARKTMGRKARKLPTFSLPRLTSAEKSTVDHRVPPSGLMQYLFRLRIKTNYLDTTMFTEGPSSQTDSEIVYRDLLYLAASTSLLNELHISHLIGQTKFRQLADTWLSANPCPGSRPIGLELRRSLL